MTVKIIAEPSGNHGGKLQNMMDLIGYAYESGADAFKPQCMKPENMALAGKTVKGGPWAGRDYYDLYKEAQTPWTWFPTMKDFCSSLGMEFMSSAYCTDSVDFLVDLGVSTIKIASFENIDYPFIRYAYEAMNGSLIISLGMATKDDARALRSLFPKASLLLCSSSYPAKISDYNLWRLTSIGDGISDHTMGSVCAVAAIASGAQIIEKHITLDTGTIDGHFSETNFGRFVKDCREAESCLGAAWGPFDGEETESRRSLWAICDIAKGEEFTPFNVKSLRPEGGLPPKHLPLIVGKKARVAINRGDAITDELIR